MSGAGGDASHQPAPGASRAAFGFIFVTVLLDMMALGIVIPVLPKLVESFLDNDTAAAARWFGLFGTVVGADAVPLLAAARRAVGPVRAKARGAAVELRPRIRLRADGACAVARLAVSRPRDFGHHHGERRDVLCLYRRRDRAGEARGGVRPDRRGLRRRLHPGSGRRRASGRT